MTEMSPAEAVFFAALEKTPADRPAYLDAACASDPALRARVEKLLAAHPRAERFLDPAAVATTGPDPSRPDPEAVVPAEAAAGTVIAGRYKLLELIGEGGMGTVWRADQTDPVKRRVAVKLIRADRGSSKTILSRFEAERQAIALMDHPHIARLLDAGTTDTGSPFFIMELVKGVPLTEFCDAHKLTVPERLNLFMQICSAVQHAHQKGVIHRDLKPTNILVESHDGKPVPKVIDFGLAKATTGLPLTEHTLFTAVGSVMGTPLYMAPEQATLNAVDVDTRADVYALGVILFELLTGTTPLARGTVKKVPLDEVLRLIREQDAPAPSSRLSASDALPTVAANRQTEPQRLGRYVKGELDWIVLNALSKDRDRRYETATGFARDIERFLNHEPVTAGPPSAAYRFKKFVRRNRPKVIAAGLVLGVLVAGVVGTTLGLVEAWRQEGIARDEAGAKERARQEEARQRGIAQEKEAAAHAAAGREKAARLEEAAERAYAQVIADFVCNDFLALTSVEGQARFGEAEDQLDKDTTLSQLLDRAAAKLDGRTDLAPRTEAELRWMIGVNLRGVGEYARALPHLERCVAIRTRSLGRDNAETLDAMNSLGMAYNAAGELEKALPLLEEALTRAKAKLGPDHPTTLASMNNLALGYQAAGKLEKALPLYEETLKLRMAKFGPDHPATLTSMNNLAGGYQAAGKLEKALPLLEEALTRTKAKFGPDHPTTLTSVNNLALGYQAAGEVDKALPLLEEALTRTKAKFGPDHPTTLTSMNNLAGGYQAAGEVDKALPLLEETLKLRKAKFGPDHPATLTSMNNLALGYQAAGEVDKALPLLEEALTRTKAKFGPDHPDTLTSVNNLALGYQAAGEVDKALPLYEETLKLRKAKLGPDHPATLRSMNNLAGGYQAAGKLEKALPLYEETLKLRMAKFGPDHPDTLTSMNNLAGGYQASGKLEKVLPLYEETLKLRKAKFGPDHPDTLTSMNNLASAYRAAGKLDRALPLYEEALTRTKAKFGPDHPDTLTSMGNLAGGYRAAGKLEKALPLYEEALTRRKAKLGPEHPDTLTSMNNLASGYWSAKRLDQSVPLFEALLPLREKKLGRNHPNTQMTVANLGVNYKDAGRLAEALPLLEEAYRSSRTVPTLRWVARPLLEGYAKAGKHAEAAKLVPEVLAAARKALPKASPQLAGVLAQYGQTQLKVKAFADAEPLLRESLAIFEKAQPSAWTTFNTMSMLGGALLGQQKYADAGPLLRKGYEGMKTREKTIPPQANTRIPEALDRLIELATATNRRDEAEQWRAERAKYPQPRPPQKK